MGRYRFYCPSRMNPDKPISDVLGVGPYGEALKVAVTKSFETAQEFLNAICQPAASEFGLLLRDNVRIWRAKNLANIANKARELVSVTSEGIQLRAHPRLVAEIVEHGSWCDGEELQSMWAGLLASSCTPSGNDDSNLLFTDILKRLTTHEARLLQFACDRFKRGQLDVSWAHNYMAKTMETKDDEMVYSCLTHMQSLGLIGGQTFKQFTRHAKLLKIGGKCLPEILGLTMYIRCQGSRKPIGEFFELGNSWPENPVP